MGQMEEMEGTLERLMEEGEGEVAMDLCEEQGWSYPEAVLIHKAYPVVNSRLSQWSSIEGSMRRHPTTCPRSRSIYQLTSAEWLVDSFMRPRHYP